MWGWRRVNISKHDHKPVIFGIVNLWDVLKKDSCRLESQLSSFSREGGGRDTTSQSDNGSHSPSIREGTLLFELRLVFYSELLFGLLPSEYISFSLQRK